MSMRTPDRSLREQDQVAKAMDIAVRLLLVAIFLGACLRILNPFITPVVLGALIAVALDDVNRDAMPAPKSLVLRQAYDREQLPLR